MRTLKNIVQTLKYLPNNWKTKLLAEWADIAGELQTHVSLEKITDDTVILAVTDSCWLQELYLLSPLIKSLINKKLTEPRIKHIKLYQKKQSQKIVSEIQPTPSIPSVDVPLTQSEKKALECIEDTELQKVLKLFRDRCLQGAV